MSEFEYSKFYTDDKIKNYISSIATLDDLDACVENVKVDTDHETFQYIIAAILNEEVAMKEGFNLLKPENASKIESLKTLVNQHHGLSAIPNKSTKFLTAYDLKVYWGDTKNSSCSYSSLDNINSEVWKVYKKYQSKFKSTFLKSFTSNDIGPMFLTINNTKALILSKYLGVFSSLLNYDMDNFKSEVKTSRYAALNTLSDSSIDFDNLVLDRNIFFQFLEELSRRTIHYTYGG